MSGSLLAILGASLLGSVHCAAMCGGFVCVYASDARELRGHALYNAGRLVSYLTLGLIAGAMGMGVNHLGAVAGLGRTATIAAGALMVAWGLMTLAPTVGLRLPVAKAGGATRWIGRALRGLQGRSSSARALAMGLLTTLIPCGWLYVFVAAAAATGSPRQAALVMFVFWAGTVPAMVAVGLGAQGLFGSFRSRLPTLSALTVVVIGLLAMSGRLAMSIGSSHGH